MRQRRLAQALRELRHEAGLTQDFVGARMGWHTSKLFRLENARSPRVDWLDVRELMDLYGVRSHPRHASTGPRRHNERLFPVTAHSLPRAPFPG